MAAWSHCRRPEARLNLTAGSERWSKAAHFVAAEMKELGTPPVTDLLNSQQPLWV
jgi:hypothetical protein